MELYYFVLFTKGRQLDEPMRLVPVAYGDVSVCNASLDGALANLFGGVHDLEALDVIVVNPPAFLALNGAEIRTFRGS